MASVTDYLINLEKLTQTNLDLLKALNDSFHSKQDYLSVNVDNKRYVIPSFISLENKINSLQENFTNLIHAPESGEAVFNMDGNSRAIEVRSYEHTPQKLNLNLIKKFNVESNNIFKDFLTPNPYVSFSVPELPNDITSVVIKKIVPLSEELKQFFLSELSENENKVKTSTSYAYSTLYKKLIQFEKGIDYVEYDSVMKLPIRKNIGVGTYVIDKIQDDTLTEDLDEIITIKIKNNVDPRQYMNSLNYRLFDETIEKELKIGDQLVTFDNTAKMEIVEIQSNTNTIKVRVLNGEYLNLVPYRNEREISSLSKLKFFSPIDFDKDKYVKVPLEEDQYIFIAIAPLNDRMNIQASWGNGVIINTFALLDEKGIDFKSYYDENVRNIGDSLYEITAMMGNVLTRYSKAQYDSFTKVKPEINRDNLLVYRINKHLDNSKEVQNIRSLYSQKHDYISQLEEIQKQINEKNKDLASIAFDDVTGVRQIYTSQLKELNAKRNELSTSIEKIINEIAIIANDTEVPIENAKYRIRGFFDYNEFLKENKLDYLKDHVKSICVEYRYKNVNQEQGNALSINGKFIFSDWNRLQTFSNPRISKYESTYKFEPTPDNSNKNEPSFNQIDIPISQGETVDIRLKVIYDLGYPFVETSTDWSPVVNIEFPEEFLKDVQILDILNENNNDIETNRFKNIIEDTGITKHINDEITDQDVKYFHKSENIASGFYTPERRIIPLKDKLISLNNVISELYEDIHSSTTEAISISISNGDNLKELYPYQMNYISVAPYDTFLKQEKIIINSEQNKSESTTPDDGIKLPPYITEGNYIYDTSNGIVRTTLNLDIHNNSNRPMKIYSMFPGKRDVFLNNIRHSKFPVNDYCAIEDNGVEVSSRGVWIAYKAEDTNENDNVDSCTCKNCTCNKEENKKPEPDPQAKVLVTQEEDIKKENNITDADVYKIAKDTFVENPIRYRLQGANQFMTFRLNDVNDGELYYILNGEEKNGGWHPSNSTLSSSVNYVNFDKYMYAEIKKRVEEIISKDVNPPEGESIEEYKNKLIKQEIENFKLHDGFVGAFLYPMLSNKYDLTINPDAKNAYITIPAKSSLTVPLIFEYKITPDKKLENIANLSGVTHMVEKTMSFDIRTSLYEDPLNYTFKVIAKNVNSTQDKITLANQSELFKDWATNKLAWPDKYHVNTK